jgi:hypothetical protein
MPKRRLRYKVFHHENYIKAKGKIVYIVWLVTKMRSDATPAYRGYRLQALYTLARVLEQHGNPALIFQPEGKEDLAIYDGDHKLLEVIQVKERSANLTLSSFEPEKPESFFYRVAAELKADPNVRISVVAFGEVGPELDLAIKEDGAERARVAQKIAAHKHLPDTDAASLLKNIRLLTVDEAELTDKIVATLRASLTGVDPASAFDLLTYWLYVCAENKIRITRVDVIERINRIGRFIAARASHHREWFSVIVPVEDTPADGVGPPDELADEFYHGVSARYEHILADLDVVRPRKLREIASGFSGRRVVIVHAASGQGKTTLALRYLHDFFPQEWRFRVRSVGSREHAASVALALTSHADAIGVPLCVYVDVSAQDRDWPDLVKLLSVHQHARVLVSIREEDWRRANVSGAELQFAEVELSFDEDEAREIYEALATKHTPVNVLDFDDAWRKFGEAGPLMEFTYLVTQGDSLRERLSQQVAHLQNEAREGRLAASEIDLLRLTAVASAFEARLRLKPLVEHLNLPAPQATLKLFEREYLLRVSADGSLVQGLHPIRSTMLTELMEDPTFAPWSENASASLPFIEDGDVESFLLYAFSRRRAEITGLLLALDAYRPDGWVAIAGVTRALIWLGMVEYIEANDELITDAANQLGGMWSYFLDFDITDVTEGRVASWWRGLGIVPKKVQEKIDALIARQTDKTQVFTRATQWLEQRSQKPALPTTDADWVGAAEALFWAGRWNVRWPFPEWLPEAELDSACGALPLNSLADLAIGVWSVNSTGEEVTGSAPYEDWLERNRKRIVTRFRDETQTVALEDDGHRLTLHFVFDLFEESGRTNPPAKARKGGDSFHYEALRRIQLLRNLLPDHEEYGSRGYGHMFWPGFLEHDETVKDGIEKTSLPLFKLVSVNSTFVGLSDRRFRPPTWREYANVLWQMRRTVLTCLRQLARGLEVHFRRRSITRLLGVEVNAELWDECKAMLNDFLRLPRTAVDEWGFTDESTKEEVIEQATGKVASAGRSGLAIQKYKSYLEALGNHRRPLANFFTQAVEIMMLNTSLGRAADKAQVLQMAKSVGINTRSARLSVLNFADALKALTQFQKLSRGVLVNFYGEGEIDRLEQEEQRTFREVWPVWYFFAFHPGRVMQNASEECSKESLGILRKFRLELRQRLKRLSSAGIQIRITSESLLWEGTPALCLTIDAHDAWDIYGALPGILEAIREAIQKVKNTELRRYVLEFNYADVVLVPLVRGKYVSAVAWRISLPAIIERSSSELGWWNYAQHQIPEDSLKELRLEAWDVPELAGAANLIQSTVSLFYTAGHIRDFGRLPDLDEQGVSQLQAYIDRAVKHLSEALRITLEAEAEIIDSFSALSEEEHEERPALTQAMLAVTKLNKLILPSDDFENNKTLHLGELIEWAGRLEQAPSLALEASLLWTADVLDKAQVTD